MAAGLGIRKLRLTGGEPLVRKGICCLVEMLSGVPGIEDVAMTTNGVLLAEHAERLKAAGLQRLNVSLDTLNREKFREISRRDALPQVLEGIAAALRVEFRQVKLNAVARRGRSEEDVARRTLQILDACAPRGGYAAGSGNTIANYVPIGNYLAMLEAVHRFNGRM